MAEKSHKHKSANCMYSTKAGDNEAGDEVGDGV